MSVHRFICVDFWVILATKENEYDLPHITWDRIGTEWSEKIDSILILMGISHISSDRSKRNETNRICFKNIYSYSEAFRGVFFLYLYRYIYIYLLL